MKKFASVLIALIAVLVSFVPLTGGAAITVGTNGQTAAQVEAVKRLPLGSMSEALDYVAQKQNLVDWTLYQVKPDGTEIGLAYHWLINPAGHTGSYVEFTQYLNGLVVDAVNSQALQATNYDPTLPIMVFVSTFDDPNQNEFVNGFFLRTQVLLQGGGSTLSAPSQSFNWTIPNGIGVHMYYMSTNGISVGGYEGSTNPFVRAVDGANETVYFSTNAIGTNFVLSIPFIDGSVATWVNDNLVTPNQVTMTMVLCSPPANAAASVNVSTPPSLVPTIKLIGLPGQSVNIYGSCDVSNTNSWTLFTNITISYTGEAVVPVTTTNNFQFFRVR